MLSNFEGYNLVYSAHEIRQMSLGRSLKDRMAAAAAVIGGFVVTAAIVLEEYDMLALESDDVRNSLKVMIMFGDDKRTRCVPYDHPGRIDEAALIII